MDNTERARLAAGRTPRLASKVKFKIVRLEGRLRLLVTAPDDRMIAEARRALQGHKSRPDTWEKIEN